MAAIDLRLGALNTVYQEHGTEVAVADRNWDPTNAPRADAMVTDRPGIAIGILTADCVPVLFAGETPDGRKVIGGAHAGWRGAISGVLDCTVDAMENLGAARDTIRAAIGPCIGLKSYEVGPEFPKPFLDQDPQNARFFRPGIRSGHPMLSEPYTPRLTPPWRVKKACRIPRISASTPLVISTGSGVVISLNYPRKRGAPQRSAALSP
jgi:YfiH family protein